KQRELERAAAGLQPRALELQIKQGVRQVGEAGERLARAMQKRLGEEEEKKENLWRLLNGFSYERVLERGFVLVRDAKARPLTSASALKSGMELTLNFHDGEATAVSTGKKGGGKTAAPDKGSGEQGSLL
ncbi:MAG: hypothetical protein HOJ07_11585, partial [Rhodospirillaceae bacterium]|nr:hypothetical protein [Rhodospirillaceae bacterium]